jgi:Leucine-rich repeat (LRR) protein
MSSGRGIETVHLQNNDIGRIVEVRSILDALPTLRYLDLSNNKLTEIPFGALHGHGTLEQLHLNNNQLRLIERDALMAMPSLRELRMRNNRFGLFLYHLKHSLIIAFIFIQFN